MAERRSCRMTAEAALANKLKKIEKEESGEEHAFEEEQHKKLHVRMQKANNPILRKNPQRMRANDYIDEAGDATVVSLNGRDGTV